MSKIKLLKIVEIGNGTIRLQSQLSINTDTADFIIEDGVLKCYGYGERGFSFYKCEQPYEIVESIKDMLMQEL